jgi:thiamine-phosphate diphosphorylase
MDPASIHDAGLSSMVRFLAEVTRRCPAAPASAPQLERLRALAQSLPGASDTLQGPPGDELTLDEAAAAMTACRGLLETLGGAGAANPVGGELHRELVDATGGLAACLATALREGRARRARGLYVIVDPQVTGGRDPAEIAAAAIRGGARMLQLRDKLRDKGEILPLAVRVQELCQAADVDLIMNDHADLAAVVGCAGMHVGQTDLPVSEARRVLSPGQVVGRSNHELDELIESQEMGADHVAFGAIFATSTKGVGGAPQGVDRLRQAREVTRTPLVAIGGITAENAAAVVEAGADAICVAAAVGLAPDPEGAAAGLVAAIRDAGGRV